MQRPLAVCAAILFGLVLLNGFTARASCPTLPASERSRLLQYVRKKYRVPETMPLAIEDASLVHSSCYLRLRFASTDPKRQWGLELFLSPDRRFLTRDLLDSRIDPIQEEHQKQRALAAALTRGDLPSLGSADAPVTLVVFSDFQCPSCARFAHSLKNEILPAEGRGVRLVFRHLPLSIHGWARSAAEASACGQEQGNNYFWMLHDFLFEHQSELTAENLHQRLTMHTVRLSKFDQTRFQRCLSEKRMAARIEQDLAIARQNEIKGTPTLFINGHRVEEIVAPEQIRTLIRQFAKLDAVENSR